MPLDLAGLTLGDVVVSGKGAKCIPFSLNGQPVNWTPDEALEVAFEPKAFSGEDVARVNLCLRPGPATTEQLQALDDAVVKLLVQNSVKIFGKVLTEAEAAARYSPSLKVSEAHPEWAPTWRVKINKSGRGQVKLWDMATKEVRDEPEVWTQCRIKPRVQLRSLWMMAREVGCLWEASALLVDENGLECPF